MDPTMHTRASDGARGLLRRRRAGRRALGAVVAVIGIIAGLLITGPLAGATPTYKFYTASGTPVPPAGIFVGVASPVTVTLGNLAKSNQPFGSAELTFKNLASNGIEVDGVPPSWSWKFVTTSSPATLLLTSPNAASIQPNSSGTITLKLTPANASDITIATVVKQSNDFSGTGNIFNNAGADPVIHVIPVTLAFQTEPSDVQQSSPNSNPPNFNYICDPVSKEPVTVSAMAGNTPVPNVPVTITNTGPGDPGLYYGTTKLGAAGQTATTDANGDAVFSQTGDCTSGFAGTTIGADYTLTASSPAATASVISTPFAVVQFLGICSAPGACNSPKINSPTNGTSGTINGNFGTPGELIGSFGQGALTCDNKVTTNAVKADPFEWKAFGSASGNVTLIFPKAVVNNLANNGTPLMQVCAGASAPFPGFTVDTGVSGSPIRYQGLLPNCPTTPTNGEVELCVVSRSKNAANEIIQIFSSDLSDPHAW